jgi:hypothetical protein
MHVVTRWYSGPGSKELIDLVLKHQDEVAKLMRGIPGLARYVIAKQGDGWMTATVCQDKAGCDASVQIAKDWIAKNAAGTGVGAPQIAEGEVLLQVFPD